jgi:hypothetical protein
MRSFKQLLVTSLFLFAAVAQADGYMELRISLFPAGSFVAKSNKVTGNAVLTGNTVTAKDIKVDTKSFDSGIDLRNEHMRKRFDSANHPFAILVEGKGQDGKGKAKLQVKGTTKEVDGTYKIVDDKQLEATFKTKASEFDIKDVSYMKVGMEDELEVFVRVPLVKGSAAETSAEKAPAKAKGKKK